MTNASVYTTKNIYTVTKFSVCVGCAQGPTDVKVSLFWFIHRSGMAVTWNTCPSEHCLTQSPFCPFILAPPRKKGLC